MKRFVIPFLVIALAVGLVAADGVANLNIKNRSASPAYFYFFPIEDGVVSAEFALYAALEPKQNKLYELANGEYQIESQACGVAMVYTETISGRWNLTVPACPKWYKVPQQVDGANKNIPE